MIEIREIPEADADRMIDFAGLVFHERVEEGDHEREAWLVRRAERIGAYDGRVLAGQLAAVPMRLAVPGAFLGCSAVTYVGVLPTHRRRGILTSMIDRMHADAVAAGRPVAALGRQGASRRAGSSRPGLRLGSTPPGHSAPPVPDSVPSGWWTRPPPGSRQADTPRSPPGRRLVDREWWAQSILPSTGGAGFTGPRVVVHRLRRVPRPRGRDGRSPTSS